MRVILSIVLALGCGSNTTTAPSTPPLPTTEESPKPEPEQETKPQPEPEPEPAPAPASPPASPPAQASAAPAPALATRPSSPLGVLDCKMDVAEQKACHAKPGFAYVADPDKTCAGGVRRSAEQLKRLRAANRKAPCVCLDDAELRRRAHECKTRP